MLACFCASSNTHDMSYNRVYESIIEPGTSTAVMLDNPHDVERVPEIAPFVNIAELRADKLGAEGAGSYIDSVARHLGIIFTNRIKSEGGQWEGTESSRLEIFKYHLYGKISMIDVEMCSSIAGEAIEAAHSAGKKAIASYHDFETTPDEEEIRFIYKKGHDLGADVVKIATTTNKPFERNRLVQVAMRPPWNLVLSGMGELGYETRVILAALRTPLMYVCPTNSASGVPGQMDHEQAKALINLLDNQDK